MAALAIPLLESKLHRPRLTHDLVQRPRLLEVLNQGLDRRLILVCAPAGFGKTTLVGSWIESLSKPGIGHLPVAWLSLDRTDSNVVVFVSYLIASLRTIFEGACENTFNLLQAHIEPSLFALTASLSNEIERLPRSFILVLDDYHMVQGEAVPDLLNDLLLHSPRPQHIVLISRSNPPLSLSKLRANSEITEIRSRDLRFDLKETAEYLSSVLQTHLSMQSVEKLDKKVEGWIGALRLATLSLKGASNIDHLLTTLERSHGSLAEYLADEVLGGQFPAIQTFLLKTCILDRFCAPLCEAVIGEGDPAWSVRACIDWLERAELFVVPQDNRKQWYRYHQLFQDLLKLRLSQELEPEQVNELHCRASAWFEQQGLMDEAMRHATLANDLDLAVELMEEGLRDVLNREDRPTLERWLRQLPEELIQHRPGLLIMKAWAAQFAWQLDLQMNVVDQVESLLEREKDASLDLENLQLLRGQILALRAQEALLRNDQPRSVSLSQQALELLPLNWTYVRGGLMLYLGMSMYASGQGEAAERLLLDQYEMLADKNNIFAMRLLHALCLIYLSAGDLERTMRTARTLLRGADQCRLPLLQSWAHLLLGHVFYQWNELDEARQHLQPIIKHRYTAQVAMLRAGVAGQALIYQIEGQISKAWELLEQTSEFDLENLGHEDASTRRLRAKLQLMGGNLEGAGRWADGFNGHVADEPVSWIEWPHLTKALILATRMCDTDLQEALALLDAILEAAERMHNIRYKVEILALRAVVLDRLGETEKSLTALQDVVELTRPGGFLRIYVDLGASMQALLERLPASGPSYEYIQRILEAFQGEASRSSVENAPVRRFRRPAMDVPELVEPLTAREFETLVLLREPLSIKEMATRLGISLGTVKRHTINLYGKLNVHTRWEAVAKAEDLKLFPPR